ncbi:4411_t:CDS:2 [Paraglomus brasilianum]|uniref:4411_t:CDS:1 n=1 Tax=Paraglomus brasilianum TaxID=144538 RepID=A0A9N9B8W2_9GLOM|nr:4411_t:CDS:2 [Paraglomus brasilianum]
MESHANMAEPPLKRKLQARHLTMITIGGTIGTGLFLASGGSIAVGGPGGALAAYTIIGTMVYFIMTSLGEMASFMPISGSFNTYAKMFVDPALGFALGWNYWYSWALTVAVEVCAGAIIMQYWLPHFPPIVWSFVFLIFITGLNLFSVRGYAEAEYWFAMIKVLTVIVFIIIGVLLDVGLIGNPPEKVLGSVFKNGTFHNGFSGVFTVFLLASFSFQGTELVGIAAGESKNPEKNIPKAIKQVFWRILLFYVLAILIIGLLISYDNPNLLSNENVAVSPFTLVFLKAGFYGAAHFMNAVVLTTVLSAGNSGLYASSRVLYNLALEGQAPQFFGRLNKNGIPLAALFATAACSCVVFLALIFDHSILYTWLLALSSVSGMIQWAGISLTHWRFRRAYIAQQRSLDVLPYRASLYPFGPIFSFVLVCLIIAGQGFGIFYSEGLQVMAIVAAYTGLPIFFILYIGYKVTKGTKLVPLAECDFDRAYQHTKIDNVESDDDSIDEKDDDKARLWTKARDVLF